MLPIFGYLVNVARHAGDGRRCVRRLGRQPQAHRRRNRRPRRGAGRAARQGRRARRRDPQEGSAPRRQGEGARAPHRGRAAGARRSASRRRRSSRRSTRREARLAERQAAVERLEKDLQARETAPSPSARSTPRPPPRSTSGSSPQQQHELERVASLTADEAKELLLKQIEGDARHDAANLLKRLDAEARETAADRAKHYITEAIQRCAAEHAIETTVSVVDLPSDDLKGRIIGREGRNIRALELATGVDLIVDDTPGAIILSGFDPYRREIAKQAIERLIADGRIHPARIEEVVQKVKDETDEAVRKEGAAVAFELGLHDLHPEILPADGPAEVPHELRPERPRRTRPRSRGWPASWPGRSASTRTSPCAPRSCTTSARRSTARCRARTSSSASTSCASTARAKPVVMAMAAHHMDIDWPSLEAMIVQAADAISAARPGARRDILESYVKRLEKLEGIADSFKGVSKSFALQAGREIRIMVESEKISDEEAIWLSKDIARRIENELEYPGQIKVTVIRETRAVDYAK